MKRRAMLLVIIAVGARAGLKVGIIGTDTSHVIAFTQILNDPNSPGHVPGAHVVAAFKGGSPDVQSSASRIDKFADELRTKWNVEFLPDIPALCRRVDAVLLESVDGRVHLNQAKLVIAAGKPVFIDKPLASTLADAREIARLAAEAGVPWFSASSLRFAEIATQMKFPDAAGAIVWGPGPLEEHQALDLSWYAIHAVELLYTLLGPGCEQVSRTFTPDADVMVGQWKDGRIGTVRALRPYGPFGAVVFRAKEQVAQSRSDMKDDYGPLVAQIVKFFETKQPPVRNEETLEIFSFMDAAQRSREAGGAPVKLR